MASIEEIRTKGERNLGKALRGLNARYRKKILAAISRHGSISKIPQKFWDDMQREFDGEAMAALLLIYTASHRSTQSKLSFQVDTETVEKTAQKFAIKKAEKLAKGYVEHTKERLGEIQKELQKKKGTVAEVAKQLRTSVNTVLSKERADGVAVTETTSGISGGQREGADEYEKQYTDKQVQRIWVTSKDDKVCPICAPLNGKKQPDWPPEFSEGPPAHPNCRCKKLMAATDKPKRPRKKKKRPAYALDRGPDFDSE